MAPTRRALLGAAGAAAATLPLAGCIGSDGGDGGDGGTDSPGSTEEPTVEPTDEPTAASTDGTTTGSDAAEATVAVRSHPEHGDVLVGPDGLTLYMFDSDTRGAGASTCYDGCASAWPALTVDGEPTAGEGVSAELTAFEREDGATQVSANGWPLYYFASDAEPGDASGQGVNDVWWVLTPAGVPIRPGEGTTTPAGTAATTAAGETSTAADGDGSGDGGRY
ncbi:COG4315 family predicted lipoprotein [Halorarum halobium]|uniref:COG4315 family predicted lipoprotein n=1 Tax=Halorarum halobium TaxID=3075121 RepID=UPI0028A688B8|nr:hypothetical protein [Halobaculum sp. XH14]